MTTVSTERIPLTELIDYAEVILDVCVRVEPDDLVMINAEVEHAPLARVLADVAYQRGARYVDIWYWDPHAKLSRVTHAPESTLPETPAWLDARSKDAAERHAVWIVLRGDSDPDLLAGVDAHRAGLDRMPNLDSRIQVQVNVEVSWTYVPYPTAGWARRVLGEPDVAGLWQHLRHTLRLDRPDPRAAWRDRFEELNGRAARLNGLGLDSVHFGGPGTDLTIGLIPQARWMSVELESVTGRRFVACLPTEEVFTTPDYRRVSGVVRSTRPLSLAATVVHDLELTFHDGVVTDVRASTGADVVRLHQATDPGAARLGEVALVDGASPIGQSGLTFFETLLDENATCHLAWGAGPPSVLPPDLRTAPAEERTALGVNPSAVHIDFMVGGPEVTVTGIRPDGTRIPILVNDTWQI